MNAKQHVKPHFFEALILILFIIALISYSIMKLGSVPHIPIFIAIIILIMYGVLRKVPYRIMEQSMIASVSTSIGAVYIFLLIGVLISSWLISGTIPTLLYIGLSIITASFFYAVVFLITSIIGTAIGSSLTTVATVGVAMLGVASSIDASLAVTAGAIVSGAFFGDKMSPLSDTTNLAATVAGIDLFKHIRNMMFTTIPAFIISLIVYAWISPKSQHMDTELITSFKETLLATNLIHWYAIIPLVVLIVCTIFKMPSIATLTISTISGIVLSYFHSSIPLNELFGILYNGYSMETGVEAIDSLLSRGGMNSMLFTIILIVLSLSMGGLLFTLGIIQTLLQALQNQLKSVGSVITGTAFTAIGINVTIGEQYLSLLLTGEAFKEKFKAVQLHPKNLARTIEDAGTVINPLVPWSVCGLFIASTLNISVIDYLPFAFFCLLSPVITILFGWLNITITKISNN
ncbi:Sodium/proton antiporter [Solibacillus isronensis B3W22]|uniref:Sodium/proton antiporter n=1 Tax=Solibacillus isronensis B3W22 TaxID=1224748 RepID=K1KTR1_9BACL|nr:Na+/H+ antiporter NhaC [Solibacillus isronensis]AMO85035.1 Na+/H+ antiporter NhaC [Solibacillus silvestris]EKB45906.1 Sodium/proton antiporter [Solibacillus isronensis B3W22]